jgi:hypothetical protein
MIAMGGTFVTWAAQAFEVVPHGLQDKKNRLSSQALANFLCIIGSSGFYEVEHWWIWSQRQGGRKQFSSSHVFYVCINEQ